MNGTNEPFDLSNLPAGHYDAVCSPEAFADMCGVSVETVTGWIKTGTVPAVRMAGSQLINLERLCEDLEQGKDQFDEGDYTND